MTLCESARSGSYLACSTLPDAARITRSILAAAQKIFRTLGAELFSRLRHQRIRSHGQALPAAQPRTDGSRRRGSLLPGVHRLLPREIRHALLHQCRAHAGTSARQHRHHRTRVHGLAAGTVLARHLRCSHGWQWKKARFCCWFRGEWSRASAKTTKNEDLEFGLERVKERLQADPSTHRQALARSILKSVGEFTCEPLVPDDMTALVFMRTTSAPRATWQIASASQPMPGHSRCRK